LPPPPLQNVVPVRLRRTGQYWQKLGRNFALVLQLLFKPKKVLRISGLFANWRSL